MLRRQGIERRIVEQAQRFVDEHYADDAGIVLFDEDWHAGVVGVVAGKLSRDLNRPCVVLGHDGGMAKGSCRSMGGVNLVDALSQCSDYLESWGGHPMAAGV